MGKTSGTGSGMNNSDHISERLKTIFWGLKYLNSVMWIRDPGWKKIRIRDGKNSDPGLITWIRNNDAMPNNSRMNDGFAIMREFCEINIYLVAAYLQYRYLS
jgi:hypothetical protein